MSLFQEIDPESLAARLTPIRPILATADVPGPIVEFKGWMPDRGTLGNPGEVLARNVIPRKDGYGPFKAFSAQTANALNSRCIGAGVAQNSGGVIGVYLGTRTKLYSINAAGDLTDLSQSGDYATAEDGNFEFTFDGTRMIATNYDDPIQSINIESGTAFEDHLTSTNKPNARHMDIVNRFLVLGNTNDTTDGAKTNRVWWMNINDNRDADPDASTLADYEDTKGYGWVQRIVGGVEYGLVILESGILRQSFTGGGEIFSFVPIDRTRGTSIPNSVVSKGRLTFYYSPEGFMVTDGTSESINIGDEKINRKFASEFDLTYTSRLSSAVDPANNLILWGFPTTLAPTTGVPNVIYAYSYTENKWARIEEEHDILLRSSTQGLTLDELDTISSTLDGLPFSLDSRAYTGGQFKIAGVNSSRLYGFFDGDNLKADIITGDNQFYPGHFSRISGAIPLVEGTTSGLSIAVSGRNRIHDGAQKEDFGQPSSQATFDFTADITGSSDIMFKSDGTKIYLMDGTGVFQYPLSTAWDISTAGASEATFDFTADASTGRAMAFKSDGTKIYIAGLATIFQYPLSTAWDLSTAGVSEASLDTTTEDAIPVSVRFKSDGTKIFVLGFVNHKIFQYPLSTAWDISTAGASEAETAANEDDTQSRGIAFNDDGSKLYIICTPSDTIYQYSLLTPWIVSTRQGSEAAFVVKNDENEPRAINFKSDGTKLYMVGGLAGKVYQYPLDDAYNDRSDPASFVNSDGICPQNNAARYHRGRLTIDAGETWTHARGIEYITEREGSY